MVSSIGLSDLLDEYLSLIELLNCNKICCNFFFITLEIIDLRN